MRLDGEGDGPGLLDWPSRAGGTRVLHAGHHGEGACNADAEDDADGEGGASGVGHGGTGGQELTLNGWGFKGTTLADVSVTVDGVPCAVTSSTLDKITCVTGAAAAASVDNVSQPGSPGLTHQKLEPAGTPAWSW